MNELYSIGKLSIILGVAIITLRRWHAAGILMPACLTPGGHRRYDLMQVRRMLGWEDQAKTSTPKKTIAYARVSSHDQKEQLQTQGKRLLQHCQAMSWNPVELISDLGSGMNYKKPGLVKLLRLILTEQVNRLVLITKDRLLRFGADLLFQICSIFSVEVVMLDQTTAPTAEQRLTEDLVEILTVFSSRLYGSRSRKNLKAVASV